MVLIFTIGSPHTKFEGDCMIPFRVADGQTDTPRDDYIPHPPILFLGDKNVWKKYQILVLVYKFLLTFFIEEGEECNI